MLNNIQALRAVAALMVVYSHVAAELGLRYSGGGSGVDVFFVISGFIIAHVASDDDRHFFARRLIRIVPTYWISTLSIFALVLAMPAGFRSTTANVGLLIRSLLFVPDASSIQADGLLYPTLIAGWTLNYEMYFYVVFAIALIVFPRKPTLVAIALLLGVMAIVRLTGLSQQPVAQFYGYPIVLEFVFGMVAYHLVDYAASQPMRLRKHVWVGCGIAGGVLLLLAEQRFGKAHRWWGGGMPAFTIVGSVVMLERSHGFRIGNRFIILLGDASYVLYLSHAYIVNGTKRVVLGHQQLSQPIGHIVGLGLIAASVAAAIPIYLYLERPMITYLKRRLLHKQSSV
jgi:peptidoglycan/LPS O-acetylase OafA/YrhL